MTPHLPGSPAAGPDADANTPAWGASLALDPLATEQVRVGQLFALLLWVGVGIVLALSLVVGLLEPLGLGDHTQTLVALAFPLPFVPFSALCLWMARRGRQRPAVLLYVWVNFASLFVATWFFEGVRSPAWLLFIWTITIAGTLLSPVYALGMTGGVIASFLFLLALSRAGLYQPRFTFEPEGLQYLQASYLFIMMVSTVGFLTFLNMRSLRKTLADLHREVEERRRAEVTLRQSEARFRSLIEKATDMIVVIGADGAITFWSPSAEETLGWSAAEAVGLLWRLEFRPDEQDQAAAALEALARTPGGTAALTLHQRHRDGSWRLVQISARNLLHDPTVQGIVANARDITAQRLLEEQFQQSQKMDALGRLVGGIAHDFNNLLVAILGGSDFVLTQLPADHPLAAEVAEIRAAGDRAAKLVRQLLTFSRKHVTRPVLTDLNSGVLALVKLLQRLIGEHIAVTVSSAPTPWPVLIDPTSLEQVVMNLALNARDAMPSGGELRVEVSNVEATQPGGPGGVPVGRWTRLIVQDTGCGMTPEVRSRIFEPFFTTKETGKGTGLGLATVFGIVEQAGGSIAVDSQGTRFSVYLPAAASAPAEAPRERQQPARGRGQRVLVVEDDASARRTVVQMLASAGYAVLEAAAPDEALLLTSGVRVELVLTDLVMPQMRGQELAARLRAAHPGLPIVFMSGYADLPEALPAGAPVLSKPFSQGTLMAAIERGLEPALPGPARD
jgi:PAS domain S-box-containing protein